MTAAMTTTAWLVLMGGRRRGHDFLMARRAAIAMMAFLLLISPQAGSCWGPQQQPHHHNSNKQCPTPPFAAEGEPKPAFSAASAALSKKFQKWAAASVLATSFALGPLAESPAVAQEVIEGQPDDTSTNSVGIYAESNDDRIRSIEESASSTIQDSSEDTGLLLVSSIPETEMDPEVDPMARYMRRFADSPAFAQKTFEDEDESTSSSVDIQVESNDDRIISTEEGGTSIQSSFGDPGLGSSSPATETTPSARTTDSSMKQQQPQAAVTTSSTSRQPTKPAQPWLEQTYTVTIPPVQDGQPALEYEFSNQQAIAAAAAAAVVSYPLSYAYYKYEQEEEEKRAKEKKAALKAKRDAAKKAKKSDKKAKKPLKGSSKTQPESKAPKGPKGKKSDRASPVVGAPSVAESTPVSIAYAQAYAATSSQQTSQAAAVTEQRQEQPREDTKPTTILPTSTTASYLESLSRPSTKPNM